MESSATKTAAGRLRPAEAELTLAAVAIIVGILLLFSPKLGGDPILRFLATVPFALAVPLAITAARKLGLLGKG